MSEPRGREEVEARDSDGSAFQVRESNLLRAVHKSQGFDVMCSTHRPQK